MSYNPYASSVDASKAQTRIQHPQPQHASTNYLNQQQFDSFQHQSNAFQQQPQSSFQPQAQNQFFNAPYNQIFSDPRAAMTLQAGEGAFRAGTHFMEENFEKMVGGKAINYYFKVSNSYVLNKLWLILFPFRNNNWVRSHRIPDDNSPELNNGNTAYAYPLDDKNAPDLYIPLMGIATYILTLALISGLKDEFTPQVFGAETSTSLLALLIDFGVLKLGLYLLNISSTNWDLIAYIGYKFVPIVLILLVKNVSDSSLVNWGIYLYLILAFAFFELRAIRNSLFGGIVNPAQNLNKRTMKNTNYFLFLYAFALQGFLFWWLSK